MDLPYDATLQTFALAALGAFCLGISKTGFPGLAILNVLIVAELFGAKNSVGVILPMLIVCDLLVYPLFRKHASWKQVWPLVPVILVSVVAASFLLDRLDDQAARRVIGAIILFMLAIQLLREFKREFLEHLPDSRWFRWLSCVLIGVSTMLANAAGPAMTVYLLASRLPKYEFVGTAAWFFFFINIIKVPFSASLGLITPQTLLFNLLLAPAVLIGLFSGKFLLGKINQKAFEWLLISLSLLGALRLIWA